ncbi:dynamin family protein [Spongisporangium articulatum]|uniref:Dynamin family protein n=1 Tax=Spongisporangium articulatum TaxID=3362603 RepID=A0ABW8AKB1_9ACTN
MSHDALTHNGEPSVVPENGSEPGAPAPIIGARARSGPRPQPALRPNRVRRTIPIPEQQDEAAPDVLVAAQQLRTHVAQLTLHLEVDGIADARREREGLLNQLDDYVLPRLRRPDSPLLAVIGGSTGAGKSTLTNSLVRREVSRSGILRPTTRSPVLVHHPDDSGHFLTPRILPRLTRVTSEAPEPAQPIDPYAPRITGLRLVPHDGLTPGLGIIDAPDIDSLVETNRDLAVQLLAAADLWIFVTTAARYSDAIPWQMLHQASERGVAVAVVLNRVPPESLAELRVDLASRLRDRGLGGAPLFTIPETETEDGFLPVEVVQQLQAWLKRIAGSDRHRGVIADRSVLGVLGSIPPRARALAAAADVQAAGWVELRDDLEAVLAEAQPRLLASLADGSLLGGEVQARWQEFVADGEFIRRVDTSGKPGADDDPTVGLDGPVGDAVIATIRTAVRAVRDEVLSRWSTRPAGARLVTARSGELQPLGRQIEVERAVHDWRDELEDRVGFAVEAAERRGATVDLDTARDVMFVVSIDEKADRAQGSGQKGRSPSTVIAARRILAKFLGEDRIRHLTGEARADLAQKATSLLAVEADRLAELLDLAAIDPARAAGLRAGADAVEFALTGEEADEGPESQDHPTNGANGGTPVDPEPTSGQATT